MTSLQQGWWNCCHSSEKEKSTAFLQPLNPEVQPPHPTAFYSGASPLKSDSYLVQVEDLSLDVLDVASSVSAFLHVLDFQHPVRSRSTEVPQCVRKAHGCKVHPSDRHEPDPPDDFDLRNVIKCGITCHLE